MNSTRANHDPVREWVIKDTNSEISLNTSYPRIIETILISRGIINEEVIEAFLEPALKSLGDPFALPQMSTAVDRIIEAIDKKENIVVYGDYDVDGVTSLTLMKKMLGAYDNVAITFMPHRIDDGYGLSISALKHCIDKHSPSLIVAVDCGTTSIKEIDWLNALGVDSVILDHHEPLSEGLPKANAVVNPKISESEFPKNYQYLCSVGIVFKLAHALLKLRPLAHFDLRDYLDIVALGTVADLVPLIDENRILVKKGLKIMARTKNTGLAALTEISNIRPPFSAMDIGFRLGPRINAAGRMDTANKALELLLCEDPSSAKEIANNLEENNKARQLVESQTTLEAIEILEGAANGEYDFGAVIGKRGWHPGVVGIVASRLSKKIHRPVFIVAVDEKGNGKGSGRSIEGISLVDFIESNQGVLENGGGHDMAAGITLKEESLKLLNDNLQTFVSSQINNSLLVPKIELDCRCEINELNVELLDHYRKLEPFGFDNPEPVLVCSNVKPTSEPRILKEKHLRMTLRKGKYTCDAIYFGGAEYPIPNPPWDVAFSILRNDFRGRVSIQMNVKAIRSSNNSA